MAVSPAERARMAALARDLASVETDEPATGEALANAVNQANADRTARGIPPLADETLPEEEFYARARALGLRRLRG